MSRRQEPTRLWLRPERRDAEGRLTHEAAWVILDNRDGKRIQRSTGCGKENREGAEAALNEYLTDLHDEQRDQNPQSNVRADEVLVADVLASYLKTAKAARPKELGQRADVLLDWWGDKTLADVTSRNCEAYVKHRSTPYAARRELEDLKAAINKALADGVCRELVKITLPQKPRGRMRYLTREEAAKLIWHAYRYREVQKGQPTNKHPRRHVARFLLAAIYTGTRSKRLHQASFDREEGRPWIDVDSGLFYRSWDGEKVPDTKRAPPVRIPGRLLAHMRRWRRNGAKYLVEWRGGPSDPKKAFKRVVRDVGLSDDVVRHSMRHTTATWLMQAGVSPWEAAGFLGMTVETLEKVYGHHHPDYQEGVSLLLTAGRAGRRRGERRENAANNRQRLPTNERESA